MNDMHATTRQHRRARVDAFYINKIADDAAHLAQVRDISVGGMFVYKLLEPNSAAVDQFTVEMQLPGCKPLIWATVEVVRQERRGDSDGYAVKFARLAEADRALIESYVAEQPMEATSPTQRLH